MVLFNFTPTFRSLAITFQCHRNTNSFRFRNYQIQICVLPRYHTRSREKPKVYPEGCLLDGGLSDINEHISSLCKDEKLHKAFDLSIPVGHQGVPTDSDIYIRPLQGCIKDRGLDEGKRMHAHMIKIEFKPGILLCNNLINMYAKCGSLDHARHVFDKMPERDMISWNALIAGYGRNGQHEEVLKHFCQMQTACVPPNQFTFASVLSTCANLADLEKGKQVHTRIIRTGFESQVFVGNALVDMYAKCGRIEDAHQLFDEIPERDDVSWNALITGYVQNGHGEEALKLFCQMHRLGLKMGHFTFGSVLKACGRVAAYKEGRQIHACIVKTGFLPDVFVISAVVDMYAKCQQIEDAQHVFDKIPELDEVSCNALITGYVQNGLAKEALKILCQFQRAGVKTNHFTFSSVLKACGSIAAHEEGKQVHGHIIKTGFESNVFVGSALVDMYGKCGAVNNACTIFYAMPRRNVVTWNAMIAGLCQTTDVSPKYVEKALKIFCEMQQAGMKPNHFTISIVLRGCTSLAALEHGRQLHTHIIKNRLELDEFVGSALVDMYAKCGTIDDACKWFDKMPKQDIVSWTTMVAGFAQNGYGEQAVKLFQEVLRAGIKPDQSTFSSVLSASTSIAVLEQGKQVHSDIIKTGFDSHVVVGNALIAMYARCGSIDDACNVFHDLPKRDVVSWTVLISGYAQHGCGIEALQCFEQMQAEGVKPNNITFVGVLSACSHIGLVDEGCWYFDSMSRDHGITPTVEHCACIVDLLGRAGRLDDAEHFVHETRLESDAVVWRALLGACRIHGNLDMAKRAAKRVLDLEPQDAATYVLLSNIYASAGRWDDAAKVRNTMKSKGVKKELGLSWIEVGNTVHSFMIGDRSHPQMEGIHAKLETLSEQIKQAGYVPDTNFVLHDVEQEHREDSLCHHSEKLAIAFGLINIPSGTPIKVIKNLRVCGDCHTATKFISKITEREIVLRDAHRFHHFKNGFCSCGDYW